MGLDDYKNNTTDKNSSTGNKRRYVEISREEFINALDETDQDFEEVKPDWTNEYVYDSKSKNGKFTIRVYSSIDRRSGTGRDKGEDAIRVLLIHTDSGRPVIGEKKTLRITTWKKNLHKKINNLLNQRDSITYCNKCNSVMVIRENSQSGDKFLGCTGYPECKNTDSL